MKKLVRTFTMVTGVFLGISLISAQENVTVVTPASEAAEGLDLEAVGTLFKDSKNLEEFEKSLNDPKTGINNLGWWRKWRTIPT